MFQLSAPVRRSPMRHFGIRRHCAGLFALAAALVFTLAAQAQFGGPPTTQVHDSSALKPPAGARVAIIEFADLECPNCAATNPILMGATAKYHIPWVRHDFPLPYHPWSFQAAVYARWFDLKSKDLGNNYRNAIFANQSSIETPAELAQWTQKFAQSHGIALPFAVDPMGTLSSAVKADRDLALRIGVEHTPTIWVVTNGAHGAPQYTEVVDHNKLYEIIDQALEQTRQ